MPGLRKSCTENGSFLARNSSRAMRRMRAGAILACATRTTSSYDMRTARWRATSFSSLPLRAAGRVGVDDGAQPVEIEPRIGDALIGNEPPHAFDRGRLRQRGQRVA